MTVIELDGRNKDELNALAQHKIQIIISYETKLHFYDVIC